MRSFCLVYYDLCQLRYLNELTKGWKLREKVFTRIERARHFKQEEELVKKIKIN